MQQFHLARFGRVSTKGPHLCRQRAEHVRVVEPGAVATDLELEQSVCARQVRNSWTREACSAVTSEWLAGALRARRS